MTAVTARDDVSAPVLAVADDGFAELVASHDPGLRRLAFRLLGDRDRMDDALQEAYVRAFHGLGRFRHEAAPATWLYRIVYNVCVEELRRSRRLQLVQLEEVGEPPDHVDLGETVAVRAGLAEALATLAPEDRAAVLLVDAQGFDYRSAAEIVGVPEGTIASRLNRARTSLRRILDDELGGDRR